MFMGIIGSAVGLLVVFLAADLSFSDLTVSGIINVARQGGMVSALDPLPEVLAAVLGLSLTVVAIVVQLASQRYSPRIVDLFMRDWINLAAFGFMVVSCIYVLLLPAFSETNMVPGIAVGAGLVLTVINFGMLLPYFGHVFEFLQPNNIITLIEADATRSLFRAVRNKGEITHAQGQMAGAIERIVDNCLAAISQSDRGLALHSVRTLERLVCHYLEIKDALPPSWPKARQETFFALSQEFYAEIVHQGTWVEAKSLLELEHVLRRALGDMPELVSQLSASSRVIGERALTAQDSEALELVIRFLNTYIRHALNAKNVRAVYNILYQYRLLSVAAMPLRPTLCVRAVEHLVYYGQLANAMGLPFVTVTVAHDVRIICEEVFKDSDIDVMPLLECFLILDQRSDDKTEELALFGVRKAQSILGAFFLSRGADDLAERIRQDMKDDSSIRLTQIRDAILTVRDRKFWEVTDRGFNFDFVEPELRRFVTAYFEPMLQD